MLTFHCIIWADGVILEGRRELKVVLQITQREGALSEGWLESGYPRHTKGLDQVNQLALVEDRAKRSNKIV